MVLLIGWSNPLCLRGVCHCISEPPHLPSEECPALILRTQLASGFAIANYATFDPKTTPVQRASELKRSATRLGSPRDNDRVRRRAKSCHCRSKLLPTATRKSPDRPELAKTSNPQKRCQVLRRRRGIDSDSNRVEGFVRSQLRGAGWLEPNAGPPLDRSPIFGFLTSIGLVELQKT
jgi:hypothetical protein